MYRYMCPNTRELEYSPIINQTVSEVAHVFYSRYTRMIADCEQQLHKHLLIRKAIEKEIKTNYWLTLDKKPYRELILPSRSYTLLVQTNS